jgi:hypothetical protein
LLYGAAQSVHVTVVNGHGEENERIMDTAILMEIENLRRASMAGLREKYREVFQEATRCRHREHLFRRIVWRLQALAEGDLSERARAADRAGCRLALFSVLRVWMVHDQHEVSQIAVPGV